MSKVIILNDRLVHYKDRRKFQSLRTVSESFKELWRYESEATQSYPTLCDPWTIVCQVPSSMGYSRREYWSGLPFPSPGDLPNPGIEPGSPTL